MFFLLYLVIILFSFLSVAFVTLFERSVLGAMGLRFGPSFMLYYGIFQPLYDFIKLAFKRFEMMWFMDLSFWILSPLWGLMLFLFVLMVVPFSGSFTFWVYGLLMVFISFSLLVYMFFFGGWSSVGVFSFIASMRVIVQMISYEVGFMFMFMFVFFFFFTFDFYDLGEFSVLGLLAFLFVWLVITVAEMSRSPFDFLEGESELVSGFNLEYLGLGFSLIFLVEYGFMLVSSFLSSLLVVGSESWFFLFLSFFVFIRGAFPRYRYDLMMLMFWSELFFLLLGVFLLLGLFFY